MKSSNITVTDGRLMRALNNATQAIANNTSLSGNNTQKDNELHVGKLTRFFYETQEAEVKLTEKTVTCKLTRPTEGSVNIFFTPFAELEWDETLRKTYFKPYEDIRCVVAKINNKYYVISYFQNDKIIPLMYICYFNTAEIIHIEEESTMKEIMDYVCNNHFIEESIINIELPKKTILEFFRNILSDEYILKLNLKQEE